MSEETQDQFNIKEGGIRLLTLGEIKLAQSVFLSTIDYSKVWIHRESYLPFNLQDKNTAMTPNGEIYFRDLYFDDFSQTTDSFQHLFIHFIPFTFLKRITMILFTFHYYSSQGGIFCENY